MTGLAADRGAVRNGLGATAAATQIDECVTSTSDISSLPLKVSDLSRTTIAPAAPAAHRAVPLQAFRAGGLAAHWRGSEVQPEHEQVQTMADT